MKRSEPTWRIPVGILLLIVGLIAYGLVVARYVPELVGTWPVLVQTLIYLVLGLIWLLPLKRFLIWMETGRWSAARPPE
ncbi:DUF2842 domain-containing protein [Parerythrobacter lacustris]|uniref:DUF2842 domain-containing protein n=1 Tax=Parerythrobacter lacustris TaxID=2969984 RepID=A0ABT1XSW2_9SPHN|nr:DUF2842 domain-containing protein [Parerythrobacter lacustris]MCR2834031.1 DUF2842 domain-containing protein [Parerythrobacter lacustris]